METSNPWLHSIDSTFTQDCTPQALEVQCAIAVILASIAHSSRCVVNRTWRWWKDKDATTSIGEG